MADIKAGSLNVEITADNKPLTEGLRKAEQQVKKTDDKLKQLTRTTTTASDAAGGGFLEATGKVQQFQSQISAALGVVAGFTAVATIVGGIAKAFQEVGGEVGRSRDSLESFERLLRSAAKNTPVLGQILGVGFSLADAFSSARFEAGTQKNIADLERQIRDAERRLQSGAAGGEFVGPGGTIRTSRQDVLDEITDLEKRLQLAQEARRELEAELSARAQSLGVQAQQIRLDLESEALRLTGKDAEADLLSIKKEELEIENQINRLIATRNSLDSAGFNNLAKTLDAQIRALDAVKKQTIELKKQAVLQKTVGDIFTGQTAAGAFKVALSVAKSTVGSTTASPSSPQGKQVTLLEEATRLLGIIANKETALT
jgi:hypothetical protein